jgi:hypothetical protein
MMFSLSVYVVPLPSKGLPQKAINANKSFQQYVALFGLSLATGPFPHQELSRELKENPDQYLRSLPWCLENL